MPGVSIIKMASSGRNNFLVFEGCNFFRQRIVLSTLTGKAVKIKRIRDNEEELGVREFEASFLRLMDKLTNGTKIEINETGTTLCYFPGLLTGGKVEHDCSLQRSIGYYLEAVLCLAPFCKKSLQLTLHGVTNDQEDPTVDAVKLSTVPVLKRFLGTDEDLQLKIVSRGFSPGGGGEVYFSCPVRRQLRPMQLIDQGKIKRIRGIAYTARVSPAMGNRMVEAAKGILLKFLPDVYINTDHMKGKHSGKSPGFGLTLVAETTNGVFFSGESCSNPLGSEKGPSIPEDIGKEAARALLEEIYRGGCIDSLSQGLACLFMVFGQTDVSKVLTGPLSPYTINLLRHVRDFLNVLFKIERKDTSEDLQMGTDKVLLTCLGVGFTNLSKTVT